MTLIKRLQMKWAHLWTLENKVFLHIKYVRAKIRTLQNVKKKLLAVVIDIKVSWDEDDKDDNDGYAFKPRLKYHLDSLEIFYQRKLSPAKWNTRFCR